MIPVVALGPSIPRAHTRLAASLGRFMLGLFGWRIEGAFPDAPKFVLIVAPHTSNWDFPVGLMAKFALRLDVRFLAKRSLFWFPLGLFLRAMGGIAIDRSAAADVAATSAREFARREKLVLVITPEGTRSRVERWKSGFYRIALAAKVPMALAVFDYPARVVRLGPAFEATGNYEADLAAIQSHVKASMARHPGNYGQ
jgi:1-acyl-sn-glycerol-3-phosphate acyltransferase